MSDPSAADAPLIRVERGDPTDEELAALVAVLAVRLGGGSGAQPPRRRSEWANLARAVRRAHQHGPGGWRATALPR